MVDVGSRDSGLHMSNCFRDGSVEEKRRFGTFRVTGTENKHTFTFLELFFAE